MSVDAVFTLKCKASQEMNTPECPTCLAIGKRFMANYELGLAAMGMFGRYIEAITALNEEDDLRAARQAGGGK